MSTSKTAFIDIQALTGIAEGNLIIAGLKALHRERQQAYRTHSALALAGGRQVLPPQDFGLEETTRLLNLMGHAPDAA